MIAFSLPTWLVSQPALSVARLPVPRPSLSELAQLPESHLPRFVRESDVALQYLRLLGPLDWGQFPDRPDQRFHPQWPPLPYAPFVAAYLVKIDQHIPYMADLRDYLVANPALVWALGFPLVRSRAFSWGFDVQASLPTHRHLSRLLRTLPNTAPQFLLDETVRLLRDTLPPEVAFGQTVAVDTKHVIAWVQENNPKAYVTDRYDKTKQPKGDPDCRLGCKRRHNQAPGRQSIEDWPTPRTDAQPVKGHPVGEFYWGYGSGIVATQVAERGEFVLAELTQPFDQADVSYFHPLMADTERRLGFRCHLSGYTGP